MTVLFADIVDSTRLSEGLDPERLHRVLDMYFAAMTEAITTWEGTVEKFIGDAVVAVFGVPAAHEDDAQRALRSAVDMLARLAKLNHQIETSHGVSLEIRIGVDTGEVLATTDPGLHQRMVSGGAVNTAARLQQAAEPGTVLVGERTSRAVRDAFTFGESLSLTLKGKNEPVRAAQLLDAIAEPRGWGSRLQTPMVGRDADLKTMLGILDDVLTTQSPRMVTVVGPAGVGKSRLTNEFSQLALPREPAVRLLRGRCLSAGQTGTFWALGEILRAVCGIALEDSLDIASGKLTTALGELLASVAGNEADVEPTIFALATSAGIVLPDNPLATFAPQAVADELARAWPLFASAVAGGGPTFLVIEDVHWAGEAMVEMLQRIVSRSSGPLMVIATARPEFVERHPHFGSGSHEFATMTLTPLSDSRTDELIDRLLSGAALDPKVRASIVDKAGGNPFFVEELIQRLVDEGALVHDRDGWKTTPAAQLISLPESLHALLAARIDALPAAEKRVLQEAAVVGQVFWAQALAETAGIEDIDHGLEELERRGLVMRRPTSSLESTAEYAFKHALLRDVAYISVPLARRARAHAEVGEWIKNLSGDRQQEFSELIAHHFDMAVTADGADLAWETPQERDAVRAKALEHLLLAGQHARGRVALEKAVDLHQRALALAATDEDRLRAHEELGDDHASAYHAEAAMTDLLAALEIARADPHRSADRSRICSKAAELMAMSPGAFRTDPDPRLCEELVQEGIAHAGDELVRGRLLMAHGAAARLWRGSEPFGRGSLPDPVPIDERIAAAESAAEIGERLGDPALVLAANSALGILYGLAGRYREHVELVRRAMASLDQVRSRLDQGDLLRQAAVLEISVIANFESGLALARRCHAVSIDSSAHQQMHATWPMLAALYWLGRWAEMEVYLEEHLAAFRLDPAIACQFVREGPLLGAMALAHVGNLDRARSLAALLGDPAADLDGASCWQSRLAVVLGDPSTGRLLSEQKARHRATYAPQHSLSLLDSLVALEDWEAVLSLLPWARQQVDGNALLEPWTDRAEGLAIATSEPARARRMWRRALARFAGLGVPFEVARTQELLANVAADREARSLRQAALDSYASLGAVPHFEQLSAALAAMG